MILETNRAWERFGREDGDEGTTSIGTNYLAICDQAIGDGADDAHAVASGIRSVINGDQDEFLYDYPCHNPTGQHWFYMRAMRMEEEDPPKIIISHEEITALKLTEEALKNSKLRLEEQKRDLEETNIALRVLLKKREQDRQDIEQDVLSNIKRLVLPYVDKLKHAPLRVKDKTVVDIIDTHLNDIVSPLLNRIANANIILTPQEMHVGSLVKDGKSSKEIADILNVAETTVHFHRKNLRKKLGLKKKGVNLRSHLMSMS
jgi:DNA-binding CsgD family transcriptional regulator